MAEPPTENNKAYPVAIDRRSAPGVFWKVWSPYHNPHLIGVYHSIEGAQKLADTMNRLHGEGLLAYAADIATDHLRAKTVL